MTLRDAQTPDRRRAPGRLVPGLLAALALVVPLLSLPAAAPAAAPAAEESRRVPRPVLHGNFADPTVEPHRGGFVGYSTGERAPHAWTRTARGRWREAGPALRELPSWSRPGDIWAADIHRVGRTWLLYYSAPVAGLGVYGRCVGVARSGSPKRGFVPIGDAPLVCPTYAGTPPAQDQLLPRDPTLPRAGVIDPSVYVDPTGGRLLLYKTDRIPSSIRIVPLSANGQRVRDGAVSQELMRYPGVIENPLLVYRPEGWVMLLSEGDYTRCTYRTLWYRSQTLLDWSVVEYGTLADAASTGLCGPGGADLAQPPRGGTRVFLHGWTCFDKPKPCRSDFDWSKRERRKGVRSMYSARLQWVEGVPRIGRWFKPRPEPGGRR